MICWISSYLNFCRQVVSVLAHVFAGKSKLEEAQGWRDFLQLVQRTAVVITEDMPVDPEAHDLQVITTCLSFIQLKHILHMLQLQQSLWKQQIIGLLEGITALVAHTFLLLLQNSM